MAIDFPNSPVDGEIHEANGKAWQYVFSEDRWSYIGGSSVIVTLANTWANDAARPTDPTLGRWGFNETRGALEVWDGTSWVPHYVSGSDIVAGDLAAAGEVDFSGATQVNLPTHANAAARPSAAVAGTIGWNEDTGVLEIYDGTAWDIIDVNGAGGGGGAGMVGFKSYTASTTYTPTAGATRAFVIAVGPGGNGGVAALGQQGGGWDQFGGGGGAGGIAMSRLDVSGGGSLTVTIDTSKAQIGSVVGNSGANAVTNTPGAGGSATGGQRNIAGENGSYSGAGGSSGYGIYGAGGRGGRPRSNNNGISEIPAGTGGGGLVLVLEF